MITAIALDDEPLALGIIENFCKKIPELKLLKVFTKPKEAEQYLKQQLVQILFLDIQMPTKTGIDFAKSIGSNQKIIFTTAFSEFAVEGFNLDATDYLLKPFSFERFEQAVQKAIKQINLNELSEREADQFLQIKADYSTYRINYKDILFFEGFDDYVKIHLQQQKAIVARITLKALMEKISNTYFMRVHRSYIVPLNKVSIYRNKHLTVAEKQIPIGGAYLAAVEQTFQKNL